MAGKAGASGRKGYYDEVMVKKIMDSANKTIYETLEGMGKFKDLPIEVLVEVAARFALKGIPQAIDVETTEKTYKEIVHKIECLSDADIRSLINGGRKHLLQEVST